MNSSYPVLPPPPTPPRRPPKRSLQIVGDHFESPRRRRRWRHDSHVVERPDLALLQKRYTDELNQLLEAAGASNSHAQENNPPPSPGDCDADDNAVPDKCRSPPDLDQDMVHDESDTHLIQEQHLRRVLPDQAAHKLYSNWLALIPTLECNYLGYMKRIQGRVDSSFKIESSACSGGLCVLRDCDVQCLHFDCK